MGVDIPQPFDSRILGPIGPVSVSGIPDTFHLDIDQLPKLQIGLDPVTLEMRPVELSLRLKEVPSTRTHLPADFNVGLSVFGFPLMCVRLCGEAQMITEPYEPNPCEHCDEAGPP
jgi:hypothetical protein